MNLHISPQRATDELLARPNLLLRVGEQVVDIGALRVVTRPDLPRLTGKAVAVLIELVRHAGSTVTRDQLFDRVWTGRFTTPDVLTQAIKELRRAFADDSKPPLYIETIPKVGYRLIARVLVLEAQDGGLFVERASVQSINDDEGPGEDSTPVAPAAGEDRPSPHRSFSWRLPVLLAVAVVVALGVWRWSMHDALVPATAPAASWRVSDVHALTSDPGSEYRPHLSPDGSRVAFSIFDPQSKVERLVVRSIEPSQLTHLTAASDAIEALPMWSPDGTRIAFERINPNYCEMFVASSGGGDERQIGKCQDFNYNYFDWTPDGRKLIFNERETDGPRAQSLFTWDLETGEKRALDYQRAAGDQDLDAHYSPDGRWISFRRGVSPYSDLYVMASSGGAVRKITNISARIFGYTWMSDSRTMVYSSNLHGPYALYALDVASGQTQALGLSPAAFPHASRTGDAVVYEIVRTQDKLTVMPLAGGAAASRLVAPSTGSDYAPALSPSGDRVVFTSDRSGQLQLWMHEFSSGQTVPLTEAPDTAVFSARWNADGTKVIAVQRNDEGRALVEVDVASRRHRVLSKVGENVMFGDFAAEPDSYLFAVTGAGRNNSLLRVDHPGTDRERRTTVMEDIIQARMDPVTQKVYYTVGDGRGLFRRSLDDGDEQLVTSKVLSSLAGGWSLVDGHVWYISDYGIRTATLHDLDPTDGSDRIVGKLDLLIQDFTFGVMPGHDSIIFSPVDVEDTDVGMFRLSRADGS